MYVDLNTESEVPVMYVLIRKDIPYVHQAVQAGHAIAKYLIEHSELVCNDDGLKWENGTLVYVGIDNEAALMDWCSFFKEIHRPYSMFIEPDWSDGPQKTAMAVLGVRGEFSSLKTIRMPIGYFIKTRQFLNNLCYKLKHIF